MNKDKIKKLVSSLQGGTGGRTISVQDIAAIRKFESGKGKSLSDKDFREALRKMMGKPVQKKGSPHLKKGGKAKKMKTYKKGGKA